MAHYHLWSEPVLVEILVKSTGKAEVPEEVAVLCLLTQCGYKAVHLTVRPNINFSKYFYKVLTSILFDSRLARMTPQGNQRVSR